MVNIDFGPAYKSDNLGSVTFLTVSGAQFYEGSMVGIETYLNDKLFSVSPNPANGLLTVNSSEEIKTIEVSAITGQVLLTQPCSNKKEELNLKQFSNGVYFIKVILPDGRNAVKKVVVNH